MCAQPRAFSALKQDPPGAEANACHHSVGDRSDYHAAEDKGITDAAEYDHDSIKNSTDLTRVEHRREMGFGPC